MRWTALQRLAADLRADRCVLCESCVTNADVAAGVRAAMFAVESGEITTLHAFIPRLAEEIRASQRRRLEEEADR